MPRQTYFKARIKMPRQTYKYHYLYKTTNMINNKFYVGMHSTDNLDDGYIGSGHMLWFSIRKYGKKNFKREFLEFFENRFLLKEREKNYVDENFIKDPMCMNLITGGGEGGFHDVNHMIKCSAAGNKALIEKIKTDPEFAESRKQLGRDTLKKLKDAGINSYGFKGKSHSEEFKIILVSLTRLSKQALEILSMELVGLTIQK
jgi:hypothetical protein